MTRTAPRQTRRKAKKSYTLSPESVDFLETLRRKRRARSVSFVLEEILQSVRREAEMATINQSVTAYYDSLSDEEAGLQSDSAARAEDITTVHKEGLAEPQGRLRQLSDRRVCELAAKVHIAMGCAP